MGRSKRGSRSIGARRSVNRLNINKLKKANARLAEIRAEKRAQQQLLLQNSQGLPSSFPSSSQQPVIGEEEDHFDDIEGSGAVKEEYLGVECKVEVEVKEEDVEIQVDADEEAPVENAGEEEEKEPRSPPRYAGGKRRRPVKNMNFIRSTFINVEEMSKEPPPKVPKIYEGNSRITNCALCAKGIPQRGRSANLRRGSSPEDADSLVMFAVKMLGLPDEKLHKYRYLFGHPRAWIRFCEECHSRINEAFGIQRQIQELEEKLRKFEHVIKDMIALMYAKNKNIVLSALSSAVTDTELKADPFHVTREIWSYVGKNMLSSRKANTTAPNDKPEVASSSSPFSTQASSRRPNKMARVGKPEVTTSLPSSDHKGVSEFEDEVTISAGVVDSADDTDDDSWPWEHNGGGDSDMSPCPSSTEDDPLEKEASQGNKLDSNGLPFDKKWCKKLKYKPVSNLHSTGYSCSLCPDLKVMKLDTFVKHIIYHKGRPYKCSVCGIYLTGSEMELSKIPKLMGSREGVPVDHVCTKATIVPATFQPGAIWECGRCNELFSSEEERSTHEKDAHGLNASSIKLPYECSWCSGSKFRDYVEWRLHRALEHPEQAKLACLYCDETFTVKGKGNAVLEDKVARKEHIKTQHDMKGHHLNGAECDFCGRCFYRAKEFQNHFKEAHGFSQNQLRSCPLCFSRHASYDRLRGHIIYAHSLSGSKEKLVCHVCPYETVQRKLFQEHKFMKHGIEPDDGRPVLSCTETGCGFKCTLDTNLKVHMMKTHNAERCFKCETCGKGFLKSTQLKTHQNIHLNSGVKPFQCEICGNSFAVKNYLYIHMRLSHQNRPFASTHKKKPPRGGGKKLKQGTSTTLSK